MKLFYITYRSEARLPMDNNHIEGEQMNQLIEKLPRIRSKTYDKIGKSQIKQKKYYDKRIRERSYSK